MVVVSHPPLIFHAAGCVDADTRQGIPMDVIESNFYSSQARSRLIFN